MSNAVSSSTANPHPDAACLNCGAAVEGAAYCGTCGQKTETHPLTIGHFVGEIAETLTHADSRLWSTLRVLILKPGCLTADFFAGRRARYLPPIRLYFILSLVFFLLLAVLPGNESTSSEVRTELPSALEIEKCRELTYHGPFVSTVEPRLRAACARVVEDLKEGGTRLSRSFLQNISKAMFLLLPLFAAFMLPFYWRAGRLYAEHLIFLLHNHSAAFLVSALMTLLSYVMPKSVEDLPLLLLLGWLSWYCYRGVRVFYRQSRFVTLTKLVMLGGLYLFISMVVAIFTGIAAVLTI